MAALAADLVRNLRFQSDDAAAALAADLIRDSIFLLFGSYTGSRIDQEFVIPITPGGCASSRRNQELEMTIIWDCPVSRLDRELKPSPQREMALAVNMIGDLRFESSSDDAVAADLIRGSKFLSSGDCADSRRDQKLEISIIRGGCASSRFNQELEFSIVWRLHWQPT